MHKLQQHISEGVTKRALTKCEDMEKAKGPFVVIYTVGLTWTTKFIALKGQPVLGQCKQHTD